MLKPTPQAGRAVAAEAAVPVVADLRAACTLFGTPKASSPAAGNYVLKGVVVARKSHDSAAIIATDGKSPQAVRVGTEVVPGVVLKEVHAQFVVLTEGGRDRRLELPEKPSP